MAKRKKRRAKKSSSEKFLRTLVWILAFVATMLVLFLAGYYFGYSSATKNQSDEIVQAKKQHSKALQELQKEKEKKESLHKQLEQFLQKEQKKGTDVTAAHELEGQKPLPPLKKEPVTTKRPKLVIIFDDVSFASQVRAIKALGFPVTMSFFPPSAIHPNTPKLAAKESFYMVHLPMEALNFHREEPYTLRVGDSTKHISLRIEKIKELFPRVHYINNHTGSKFTADYISVKRLIKVLDNNNIKLLDSRTTAKTKVPVVMKELGREYVARDVFLDHKGDVASIKKQIGRAIKLAKKYGVCIAIGHPHPNTIKALAASKNLLQQVQLVQLNAVY